MRKIGGVNMNTVAHLTNTKEKASQRYCSVYESLKESLREVKLHKQGKIKLDTWEEYLMKKNNKEK